MNRRTVVLVAFLGANGSLPTAFALPQHAPTADEERKLRLQLLARDARDQNDKQRLKAWEDLLALGDDGVKVLRPIVEAKFGRDRKALEERFKGQELARAKHKVEEALVARRQDALAFIFDPKRYPDENHGAVGQPEVDRLVALVSAVYDHPATFTRSTIPEVETLAAALEEDVVYLETCGGKLPDDLPTVARWLDHFNAAFTIDQLGISEQQHEWNATVAKYHAEENLTSADAEELACMNATNAYRLKMGLKILEIDERLVRAARKHSQEMKELGYFAHDSPRKENASFGARCAREGYGGAGGENIAGAGDGVGAFRGWYGSSGHHRNMLGGFAQIGVGRCDELWTQDLGGGSSLRGRTIDDPQILYLGQLKKLDASSAESETALARWCKARKLDDFMLLHARRALALDPEYEKAHELLGETKVNGRWVQATPSRDGGGGRAPRAD